MINFALGEWVMCGSRLAGVGAYGAGRGAAAALGFAGAAMVCLALAFNWMVLRRLVGQPLIGVIMVTLGLGVLMRGAAPFLFAVGPGRLPLPIPEEPLVVLYIAVPISRLVALIVAVVAIAAVTAFFRWTRTGLALRALADDQEIALSVGIDVNRHLAITWGLVGVLAVLAGTLWALIAGVGFGVALLGLKVFPVVVIGGRDSIPGSIGGAVWGGGSAGAPRGVRGAARGRGLQQRGALRPPARRALRPAVWDIGPAGRATRLGDPMREHGTQGRSARYSRTTT